MGLVVENACICYDKNIIVDNVNYQFEEGKITCIIGKNGTGKSSLLQSFAAIKKLQSGKVKLNNKLVTDYKRRDLAKLIAYLPQTLSIPQGITVRELVELGRYCHAAGIISRPASACKAVESALIDTDLLDLQDELLTHISGGQRQRAWLAMILAQESPFMLLDEPTSGLDIAQQLSFLKLLQRLTKDNNKTIVMVLHDLTQVLQFVDIALVLHEQTLYAHGKPTEVLTEAVLKDAFDIDAYYLDSFLKCESVAAA